MSVPVAKDNQGHPLEDTEYDFEDVPSLHPELMALVKFTAMLEPDLLCRQVQ